MRTEREAIQIGNNLLDWMDTYGKEASTEDFQRYQGKIEMVCWFLHIHPRNVHVLRAMQ